MKKEFKSKNGKFKVIIHDSLECNEFVNVDIEVIDNIKTTLGNLSSLIFDECFSKVKSDKYYFSVVSKKSLYKFVIYKCNSEDVVLGALAEQLKL